MLTTWNPALFDAKPMTNIEVSVLRGDSFANIASRLESQHLIHSAQWLKLYAIINGLDNQVKMGRYDLSGQLSAVDILQILVTGKSKQNRMTIIEGWRFKDLKQALLNAPNLDVSNLLQNEVEVYIADQLGFEKGFIDGAFLAESYYYEDQTHFLDVLRTAHHHLLESYNQIQPMMRSV